jgi:hypothetical protein
MGWREGRLPMRNIDEIRAAYERGEGNLRELAEKFDAPYSTLTRRCSGEEWRKPRARRGLAQMSVHAYAYVHGFWLTRDQLNGIASRAQEMCLAQKKKRAIKDDDRFGLVFTYPVGILTSVFAEKGGQQ